MSDQDQQTQQQQQMPFGKNASDIVSVVALIISLAAFVTTILQVLQQYLASADGYRRCAPSVIGLWSNGTHRKFRQRELRFEVVFETPVLFLAPPENTKGPIYGRAIHNIDGSDDSYKATNTLKPDKERISNISTADDERASWVTLLAAIQKEEADSREWEQKTRVSLKRNEKYDPPRYSVCHSMQKKTRSYDFMPPAVTKPYATTTISHLVEMVGMLGMYWKAFEVVRGNIRAEGNGYILTSTLVHGLGLMSTFSVTGPSKFLDNRVIPFHDVKELVFGFVPSIMGRSLELGSVELVKKTLASMKCEPDVIATYELKKDRLNMFSVTFELIAMLAQTYRIRCSNLKMLPNPTADRWPGDASVIEWTEEMKDFQDGLEKAIISVAVPGAARHPLLTTIADQWTKLQEVWAKDLHLDMRESLHDALDATNAYLLDRAVFSAAEITSVVASHISIILAATDDLQVSMNAEPVPNIASPQPNTPATKGKLAKYYLEKILTKVANDGLNLSDEVQSRRGVIWFGLMFRLICWLLLHDFDKLDVNMMPSDMKGSRMPVFIG